MRSCRFLIFPLALRKTTFDCVCTLPVELAGIGPRVDNPPVDFKKVAEGFGLYGDGPIRRPEDLRPALQKALAVVKEKRLPALVDVVSAPR